MMYMRGLKGGFRTVGTTGSSGGGTEQVGGISQQACAAMGGQWQNLNPNNMTLNPVGMCTIPKAAPVAPTPPPPANISVSVPTSVNTTVSPQISPNFIQQDQPTNSPINAATKQESAGDAAYQALLDRIAQATAPQAPATIQSGYTPSYSGGSPAVFAPEPQAPEQVGNMTVANDFSKYIPFALIGAALLIFASKNKEAGNVRR